MLFQVNSKGRYDGLNLQWKDKCLSPNNGKNQADDVIQLLITYMKLKQDLYLVDIYGFWINKEKISS